MHFLFLALAIAGFTAIWNKFRADNAWVDKALDFYLPEKVAHAIKCGYCFPYWLSLLGVLVMNPFPGLYNTFRIPFPEPLAWLVLIGMQWMAVALFALALRGVAVTAHRLMIYSARLLKQGGGE